MTWKRLRPSTSTEATVSESRKNGLPTTPHRMAARVNGVAVDPHTDRVQICTALSQCNLGHCFSVLQGTKHGVDRRQTSSYSIVRLIPVELLDACKVAGERRRCICNTLKRSPVRVLEDRNCLQSVKPNTKLVQLVFDGVGLQPEHDFDAESAIENSCANELELAHLFRSFRDGLCNRLPPNLPPHSRCASADCKYRNDCLHPTRRSRVAEPVPLARHRKCEGQQQQEHHAHTYRSRPIRKLFFHVIPSPSRAPV